MSQRFQIDGVPVEACEGVFSCAFDMDAGDAEEVRYDQTYVLVVVATTLPPGFRTDRNGDLIRRNRFQVSAAKVAKGTLGDELAEMFDLDIQQRLPFAPPPGPAALPTPVKSPPAASQSPVKPPITAGVASGPTTHAAVPVGVPVGRVDSTEDEALLRFLEGGE
jgi:hypothetical protein